MAAKVSCNQNEDCKEASKSELTEEVSEVPKDDNAKELRKLKKFNLLSTIVIFVILLAIRRQE